jgi:hypothetical protein
MFRRAGERFRAAFASSTVGLDGELSLTTFECTSDTNQFWSILADENKLTFRFWSGLPTFYNIRSMSLSIYAQFKIQSVKKGNDDMPDSLRSAREDEGAAGGRVGSGEGDRQGKSRLRGANSRPDFFFGGIENTVR